MSAVSVLASALQSDSGAGAAVDVSAFCTLRLNWSVLTDVTRARFLRLFIETRSDSSQPWREIFREQLDANGWDLRPRVTLSGFDNFVRARWEGEFARSSNNEQTTKFFTIGLTGEGTP